MYNPDELLQPEAWAMALVIMRGCYPGKIKLTEMESAIWYETLKGYTNDQVIKAIPQMAKTAEFPSINALCAAIADSEELGYIAAYAEAQRYCVLASSPTVKKNHQGEIIYKPDGYPEMNKPEDCQVKDPLVKKIVANFGGAKKFLDRQNSAENTFFCTV